MNNTVVIVGAGHAGAHAAISLRKHGHDGDIVLLGDEPYAPYERPPLSKTYLAGQITSERLAIRPDTFWTDNAIKMELGQRVVRLEAGKKRVELSNGKTHEYGTLVWATGGSLRRLSCPGHDLDGVHTIHTRADVDRILDELPLVHDVVVIGGGFIGLEAAATLTSCGKRVTIIETQDRVLARVAGAPLSHAFQKEHHAHGVDFRLGASVAAIEGDNGRAIRVQLADGDTVACQMVIVGIGIIPDIDPLCHAGAVIGNGVEVDRFCKTSLPDVYAIGDCAAHPSRFAHTGLVRLESVQNAVDQATTVAQSLTGEPRPYSATPWFWSHQYALKLQTIGLSTGYDQTIVRGDIRNQAFSVIYLKAGCVIALDCVNMTKDFVQGRALVEAHRAFDTAELADTDIPLKTLLGKSPGEIVSSR